MSRTSRKVVIGQGNLEHKDALVFQSLIELLGVNSGVDCELVESGNIQAEIIDVDDDDGRLRYQRLTATAGIIPIAYSHQSDVIGEFILKKPVRGRQIIEVLKLLDQRLNGVSESDSDVGESIMSFTELVDGAMAFESAEISGPGIPTIAVSQRNKKVWMSAPLCNFKFNNGGGFESARIRALGDFDVAENRVDGMAIAMQTALWEIATTASQGQLLQRLRNRDRFVLWRWPEFGLVPHSSLNSRLAAAFTSVPRTIGEVAQRLSVNRRDVVAFINACALCGWLEQHEREYVPAPPPAIQAEQHNRIGGALRLIRAKLGI